MIWIYSKEDKIPSELQVVKDVEAQFRIQFRDTAKVFEDNDSDEILSKMIGMTSCDGGIINTNKGAYALSNLPIEVKACLLAVAKPKQVISTVEMYQNCIDVLGDIAIHTDIYLFAPYGIDDFSNGGCNVMLDNKPCNPYEMLFRLDEILGVFDQ